MNTASVSRPFGVACVTALAAGLALAACSAGPEAETDDPVDGFCLGVIDADAALRDLSDATQPAPGLQAATEHLGGFPSGTFRDQATLVLRRLETVAQDGVGPVSDAEQVELRLALSGVSSECTSRGHRVNLLQGFSAT